MEIARLKERKKKNVIAEKIKLGKKKRPAKVGSTYARIHISRCNNNNVNMRTMKLKSKKKRTYGVHTDERLKV